MPRWFNVSGPCRPDHHFMVPTGPRLPTLRRLIERQGYFVLHAPRQVGKTTTLTTLARELTAEGKYAAALVSVEVGAPAPDQPEVAELAIMAVWRSRLDHQLPSELLPPPWPDAPPLSRIRRGLSAWARACPRPIVLFIDEIDALQNQTLMSVLRQLRDGYSDRPESFPWSLGLCGMRDVRDYKVASGGSSQLGTASPFNVKDDSLRLLDFTQQEVEALYTQHTSDTGQVFTPEALARAFELTRGQPWLVNALARQVVDVLVTDRSKPIGPADIDAAKEILIERQDTHLDSLVERLREPRIQRLLEPMLAGTMLPQVPQDDIRFAIDLGLVRKTSEGGLAVSNPIYAEVIPTALAYVPRASLPQIAPNWLTTEGRLDIDKLLDAFLAFWRRHGEPLLGSAPYHEIAPHLVLMAFLHRVVNGGGTLEREYAIGRGRMDLCLRYGDVTLAMELKVHRDGEGDPTGEGLEQLDGYLAGLGLQTGWLVIFDRRSGQPRIAQRTTAIRQKTPSGYDVVVLRA